ncbi:MAG: RsiW-degrading membrane proteinase PrsW (M82 family) [Halieaceae bacterium]|jgi:RsiW-degrading membrane proteinase PrsW (M82 family)
MDTDSLVRITVAILPVLLLLFTFDRLDVFDLIIFRVIALLLIIGILISVPSFFANWLVLDAFDVGFDTHSRYISPWIEESLKMIPVIVMFAHNRLGYKLDAGIAGFAVGAGFAVAENIWYLNAIADANFSVWLVRGFGTAVMHGGATAVFAIVSQQLTEHQAESDAVHYRFRPVFFLPGLVLAVVVHSGFNHFPNQPVAVMIATLLAVPLVLFLVFNRNQGSTQSWLRSDASNHRKEIADLKSGAYRSGQRGRKVERAVAGADDEMMGRVFAYIEVKTALILRAEEMIMAAHDDQIHEVGPEDVGMFLELETLERQVGPTLLAAIEPVLGFTRNDLWELSRLQLRVFKQRR